MASNNMYFKFLHLAQAVQKLPSFPQMDSVEERLLNVCASVWFSDMKISVTEIANMLPGTSERTSHRRIKSLLAKNMIILKNDDKDKRVKYIMPTQLADKYFKKMEGCLQLACR